MGETSFVNQAFGNRRDNAMILISGTICLLKYFIGTTNHSHTSLNLRTINSPAYD